MLPSDMSDDFPPAADASMPVPALDAAALAKLRELDPSGRNGVLARLLATYDASLRRMLGQLEAERASVSAQQVATIAHTLKSSSASLGALDMARTCAEIEARLRRGEPEHLQPDIDRMLAQGQLALRAVAAAMRQ